MMHVETALHLSDLPRECIEACSAQGPCDDAVAHWRDKLRLTVDRAEAEHGLAASGAWSREELALDSDEEIAERVLWLACCDFREYLHEVAEGRGDDPRQGSDLYVLSGY